MSSSCTTADAVMLGVWPGAHRHKHRNACSRCLPDDETLESVPGACSAHRRGNLTDQELWLLRRLWLQVLIISYETFRLHAERFAGDRACDLLICDEAHRLKSDQTLTSKVNSRAAGRCILSNAVNAGEKHSQQCQAHQEAQDRCVLAASASL